MRFRFSALAAAAVLAASWAPPAQAGGLGSSGPALAQNGRESKPPVVLITVDTLRADHTSPYGYEKAETPVMEALAREGVVFEKALVHTPITLPSHATILTGTYPHFHGLQDVVGRLREDIPTLAEWFRGRGYATAAFVGASVLSADWGLDRGFQHYDDEIASGEALQRVDFDRMERPASAVIDRALAWMDVHREEPYFLWVHLYDPHDPYEPPEPYRSRFAQEPYDGEIAYVDFQTGRLIERLKSQGLYDPALIVFTADHGESLGEHGERYHAFFIYESVLRVPLIIKAPHGKAGPRPVADVRVKPQVRAVDLAPTICQLLGESIPSWMQGQGLLAHMLGRRDNDLPAYAETHYPRIHFGWAPLFSLSTGHDKFIQAPQPELYDLQEDPGEGKNLHAQDQALANRLAEDLTDIQGKYASRQKVPSEEAEVDPETMARLQSLGYVAFSQGGTSEDYSSLPDPKDKIGVYNQLNRAIEYTRQGRMQEALSLLEQVAAQEPEMPLVHFLMASEYSKAGMHLKAIEQYRETLRRNPESDPARFSLARSYVQAGLASQAVEVCRELIERDPGHYGAHEMLARLLMRGGNTEEAIEQQRQAIEIRPQSVDAHNNLGAFLFQAGRLQEAAQSYRRALEIAPGHPQAHINLTLALLQLRDFPKALEEARRAVQAAPDSALAHLYLGHALLGNDRIEEARQAYGKAKAIDPNLKVPSI
ncbi:MAG TPA: sulfatase-like hydrolase/transferase [Acidobacteriota bacterium]|nr:sulfatase-like hydrolase/transferase [Acidobacteriota bacterium]